jgi:hypothetical protein
MSAGCFMCRLDQDTSIRAKYTCTAQAQILQAFIILHIHFVACNRIIPLARARARSRSRYPAPRTRSRACPQYRPGRRP